MKSLIAFIAGLIFSTGLIISQMIDPGKVLAFLTINANWDPSLILVMGAGVFLMWGANLLRRTHMSAPLFADVFHIPKGWGFDGRLILGAVFFGLGWGLVGLCPAPMLAALVSFKGEVWLFFAATCAGVLSYVKIYKLFK